MKTRATRTLVASTILALICLGLVPVLAASAQASGGASSATASEALWNSQARVPAAPAGADRQPDVRPDRFVSLTLDKTGMASTLATAPLEFTAAARRAPLVLSLPTPDGDFARFSVEESPVVAPELAARYPEITTYGGQGIDDPRATIRLDLGLTGFHAQVLSPHGSWYIDPYYHLDDSVYVSYYGRDLQAPRDPFFEPAIGGLGSRAAAAAAASVADAQSRSTGTQLRTYRLALAADGEYSAFHGGTVPLVHNALVTAVNRVTGIYQTELAIRLQLVANNDSLIYLNASTDPYSNTNASALLTQNQTTTDNVIGNANYDIGHVFTTGGGGLAYLAVAGETGWKARGETGNPSPVSDSFWVDYVAHEMGHQFGANHTFNGIGLNCSGNANSSTAMEPGSGSSIMAYAGICDTDDLQPHSDPFFHAVSFDEIVAYTTTAGSPGNLGAAATTNGAPTVAVTGGPYTIPMRTPFALSATGSDPNGDPLTYLWEQYDGGAIRSLTSTSKPSGALFRSFTPTEGSTRTFPKLSSILANNTNAGSGTCSALPAGLPCWSEFLPTVGRSMTFRVTARDNRSDGGGVNSANTTVTVVSTGPFRVNSPNTPVTLSGGSAQTVTWNVASTNVAPVNTANVDILLSTDGGNTFLPTPLASNTPNDGTQSVTLPNAATTQARVKVAAVGNVYFDLSDANFTITSSDLAPPDTLIDSGPTGTVSSTTADFTFHATETATFQCNLDSLGWSACTSTKSYAELADGPHTFQVRAIDTALNTDATPASRTWTVEAAVPDTFIDSGPTGASSSTTANFTFHASEPSTFECNLDSLGWSSCASPKSFPGLLEGPHAFDVRATDAALKTDLSPASRAWTIETTPPDTTIDSGPVGTVGVASATFTFSGTDTGSGVASFQCALDAAAFSACTSPKSYTGLSNASHTFYARAIDVAGNVDASAASRTWTVAAGPPPYQPDGMIRPSTSYTYLGNNIYNTTGIGQSAAKTIAVGYTATYYVKVQNDGTRSDAFKVKGCTGANGFTVTYKVGVYNVTTQVVAGTYQTASLGVGAYKTIIARVKASTTLARGQTLTCPITATSVGDATRTDVVSAATTGR